MSAAIQSSALTDDELQALRAAFHAAQQITDSRGYGHFASLHGFPEPGYCEHRNQLFLPWHRGYLYFFEQALQDLMPGVTLPWWGLDRLRGHPGGIRRAACAGLSADG